MARREMIVKTAQVARGGQSYSKESLGLVEASRYSRKASGSASQSLFLSSTAVACGGAFVI
jgi:hypothetical protein